MNSTKLLQDCCAFKDGQFSLTSLTSAGPISFTLGGIVERSYSPLIIYKLSKNDEKKIYYFAMEIPAAFHGLQNQYNNIRAQFHFGKYDPIEQAEIFQKEVQRYYNKEENAEWHNQILLVPLSQPSVSMNDTSKTNLVLETLWNTISESETQEDARRLTQAFEAYLGTLIEALDVD
ncbi:unnamed protein product [Didymodactylos carnosus]|uniref:Uncharacterized protein n=3 Tax=Didymodactylos carnosus TaxID=1234261 RepID=A0A815GJL7_9BILA|nr:unnamed protein product [Didymodactylos carnosus]CAF4201588.1 unnamed protein product [Didymodactylos carnosus]